jgi:Flp pilus assembly pilin Flp
MNKHLSNDSIPTSRRRSLRRNTRGAGLVEYIVLVGLVALAAIAGFRIFGTSVNQKARTLGGEVRDIR